MTALFVDGDACPVRDEVYRVADRLGAGGVRRGQRLASDPSRGRPNVRMITVPAGAGRADDWIAEHITAADVCITTDIPLAARCLANGARAWRRRGKSGRQTISATPWPDEPSASICGRSARATGGPARLINRTAPGSSAPLDTAVQAARRG